MIFKEAGAEWCEAGCSMCLAMNGDRLQPGQYAISTSNRNFEGPRGPQGRTFIASPLTAAAPPSKPHRRCPGVRAMNQPLGRIDSTFVALPVDNVDTDQICPARFLTTTSREAG